MKIPFSPYDFFGYLSAGLFVIVAVDHAAGRDRLFKTMEVSQGVFCLLAGYIAGHVIANLASYFLENLVTRRIIGRPTTTLFNEKRPKCSIYRPFLFPLILRGYYEPLPRETCERVLGRAKAAGINAECDLALFFHCHAIVKRDRTTLSRLDAFLNQYGFCRNISFAAFVSAAVLAWHGWNPRNDEMLIWAATSLFVSVAMFYRFIKFYRHYAVEVFTTYAEFKSDVKSPAPGSDTDEDDD